MTLVAHVTDLHLVERDHHKRCAATQRRLRYLNTGRKIDVEARLEQAREALRRAARCDHLVITGDLTEDGTEAQFELLAEILAEAGLPAGRVTLVPGNHDIYTGRDSFQRALAGPLRPYARTSTAGQPVELDGTVVMPVSTAMPQRFWFSAGALGHEAARALDALAHEQGERGRTVLVAQHHPPLGHRNPIWNFIDGMRAPERSASLLHRHAHLHVLHGHNHERKSYRVRPDGPYQIHSGAAVLSSSEHVRFYDAVHGELRVLDEAASAPVAARLALS